jgi:Protein of unknown function (DUF1579)
MMMRRMCAVAVLGFLAGPAARAQEPPKPGPEHDLLKKMVGTWDVTMNFGGMESKGTMTHKMVLGGLWLSGDFEGDFGGMKFQGHGMDSYDPVKKKYVGVFVDSMSTSPMVTEGTYDKEKKTLTMTGEGPGMDGKPTKYKSVSEWKDDDTILITMNMGEGKDSEFKFTYKRKK